MEDNKEVTYSVTETDGKLAHVPEPSEDEEKELPMAKTNAKIKADADKPLEDTIEYKGERYAITYRNIPWQRGNQIEMQARMKTEDNPKLYKRFYQDLLMDERIISINNDQWKTLKTHLDMEFGEALREWMFEDRGTDQMNELMMEKLAGELKIFIREEIGQHKGFRKQMKKISSLTTL